MKLNGPESALVPSPPAIGHLCKTVALLARGYDPQLRDERGLPALHVALGRGQSESFLALIAAGADVEERDSNDFPTLHKAIIEGLPDAAIVLLAAGADPNSLSLFGPPLSLVIRKMPASVSAPVAMELIERGADLSFVDEYGDPLLRSAIDFGETEIALALLEAGADPSARDPRGRCALMGAIFEDDERLVRALASRGDGLWAKDNDGRDALDIARLAREDDPGHRDYSGLIIAAREAITLSSDGLPPIPEGAPNRPRL
jgi:uncharacterized protein